MDVIKEWVAAVEGHRLTANRLVTHLLVTLDSGDTILLVGVEDWGLL